MKSLSRTPIARTGAVMAASCALASVLAFTPSGSIAQEAQNAAQPAPPPPPAGSVGGMGDVNLFPKRVVLNGRREIASIGLYNKTTNDGDYEIKIVDMAMAPDGRVVQFANIADETMKARVKTASGLLRHSPRRVALRGSESQLVRVMARVPAEVPDGEYRSHFVVSSVPQAAGGFSIENASGQVDENSIAVSIRPRFGISIPVIVRIGATTLQTGIINPSVITEADGSKAIAFTLTRAGTRSAYGNVVITARGSSEPVAIAKGIGVYPEVDSRDVAIAVNPEIDPALVASGARLKIEFVDDDFEPGTTLAAQEFVVP